MTENIQKKLAAIMFTSLVEYDEYVKKDEKYGIQVLNEHKKILSGSIKEYNGNIIKWRKRSGKRRGIDHENR